MTLQPQHDCDLCPRLVEFRSQNKSKFPEFHNGPVPSFGSLDARLLIVGLAPGLKGANQTGRPFTGDYAGDLLYATLLRFGFAEGQYGAHPDDGLRLIDCRVTNAVRCVPPENKPVGAEVAACRPFLQSEIAAMPDLRVVVALGGLGHNAFLAGLGVRKAAYPFGHCAVHEVPAGDRVLTLTDSYHCSRYNTNTGRLTTEMFETVFRTVTAQLEAVS
ncbi:MAG: uracil-DNA glycosylase family 4 [Alphaproteobacteria bacterium]